MYRTLGQGAVTYLLYEGFVSYGMLSLLAGSLGSSISAVGNPRQWMMPVQYLRIQQMGKWGRGGERDRCDCEKVREREGCVWGG